MVYPTMIPMKAPDLPPTGSSRGGGAGGDRDASQGAGGSSGRPERNGPSVVGSAVSTAGVALRSEIYRPTIFGFQVNEIAKLQRWQLAVRDR